MTSTEVTIDQSALPPDFAGPGRLAQVVYGVPIWWVGDGEDSTDFDLLYAHTTDQRRALAAANYMARTCPFPLAEPLNATITESGWCLLATECGCTEEQHAQHDEDCELDHGCQRPGLPPCHSDPRFDWMVEECEQDTPGALPFLLVELS